MEDLSVVIKRSLFEDMYKKKTEAFGTIQDRVDKMNAQRKNTRLDVMNEKRRIPTNMSPFVSPAVMKMNNKAVKSPKKTENPVNKRLEMLAKWKAEKEKKKMEQKRKQKPVFKVTHVPVSVGLPNLETINSEIKGKPFKSKFAPPNHKFKPPPNIQPINFPNVEEKPQIATRMVTRSQSRGLNYPSSSKPAAPKSRNVAAVKKTTKLDPTSSKAEIPKKNLPKPRNPSKSEDKENKQKEIPSRRRKPTKSEEQTKAEEKTPARTPRRRRKSSAKSEEDNEAKIDVKTDLEEEKELKVEENVTTSGYDKKTPAKAQPPVYVSPFVTVTRGKNSARKEYEARKSRKSFSSRTSTDHTSPKAGAEYFTWRLDNQINRLQGLCDQWNTYKEQEESVPEEAISMIDVAIGQTNLLITKKFVQFRGLIERCKNEDSETPVTCEDLHGFWDMIHIQIDNLDKRFDNLEKLKANNWLEIVPEVKKGPAKKKVKPVKTAKASAGLMEAIRAARKKKSDNPERRDEARTPSQRISTRLSSVKSAEKHRNSSPGLTMMKVSQYAKEVETPMKSILKSDRKKSTKSLSKTVLFENINQDVENDLNFTNSQSGRTSRRSMRLSKVKLF